MKQLEQVATLSFTAHAFEAALAFIGRTSGWNCLHACLLMQDAIEESNVLNRQSRSLQSISRQPKIP